MKSSIFSTRKDAQSSEEFERLKSQLEQQLRDIAAEKADVIRESQVLKEQLRKSEKERSEARERMLELEEILSRKEEETGYGEIPVGSDEAQREALAQAEALRRENGLLKAQIESLREENSASLHTIGELQNQLDVKGEIIDGQKGAIRRSEERIEELERELLERGETGAAEEDPENAQRIEILEKELRKTEILLKHYEDAEKNNILLNQDLAKAKSFIRTLKKSIAQLMEQMESQQNGIQYFAENIAKQQNDMKEKLQEMTEVQLRNVELQDSLSNMTDLCETLKKKNETLLHENEALRQSVRSGIVNPPGNIITPEKFEKKASDLPPESRTAMALSRCEDAYTSAKNLLSGILEDGDIDDDVFDLMS